MIPRLVPNWRSRGISLFAQVRAGHGEIHIKRAIKAVCRGCSARSCLQQPEEGVELRLVPAAAEDVVVVDGPGQEIAEVR